MNDSPVHGYTHLVIILIPACSSTVRPATSIMATQLVTSQSCVGNCTMLQQVPVSSRASFRFTTKEVLSMLTIIIIVPSLIFFPVQKW